MVTFQQLRSATTDSLRGSADSARKLARELEQYGTDTDRNRQAMSAAWEGQDASAAGTKLTTVAGSYRDTAMAYGQVDTIVSRFAGELDQAKHALESAVAAAASVPGRVGDDGSVHVNWPALGPNPSPAAVTAARQRAVQVAGQLREALMRAAQADQQATQELSAIAGAAQQRPGNAGQSRIPAHGTDPAQVKQWWDGMSAAEREDLINAHPDEVGGLDGVPIQSRDQANRLALGREIDEVTARQESLKKQAAELSPGIGDRGDMQSRMEYGEVGKQLRDVNQRAENLESIQEQLNRTDLPSSERLHLIDYDSASDGRLVASLGNPDTADNVVTYVPGMTTDVEGIGGAIDRSALMQTDAVAAAPGTETASVMWLGYDAPDGVFSASTDGYYEAAADDLSSFQNGLRATHEGAPSTNTLLGHSYGSTTVINAATQNDLAIDNLVLVASPGGPADTAGDFQGIGADHVWATRGSGDIIQYVPEFVHGNDPVDADFGARVFPSGDSGHSDYWDQGAVARDGFANIITGQYDQVNPTLQDPATLRMEPAGK